MTTSRATTWGNYMNSRPPACSPQCVSSDRERTAWIRAANTKPLGEFYEQIIRAIYTAILQPGDLALISKLRGEFALIPVPFYRWIARRLVGFREDRDRPPA